jgi:hypothetical protein
LGLLWSMAFGPTDSAAGTKTGLSPTTTLVGRQAPPSGGTIRKIRIGKGNIVDAKECAGIVEIEVSGVSGPFQFAYGNGSGAATNSGANNRAEPIDCAIPVPGNAIMKVWVTDAEVAKDVTVSLEGYSEGGLMKSYVAGGPGSDTTAATALTIGTITPIQAGVIKQIRFAGSGIVDAKAGTAKLTISIPGQAGPFEFSVGNGPGGDSLGCANEADVIGDQQNPLNIPVSLSTITCYITSEEIMLSCTVSLLIG